MNRLLQLTLIALALLVLIETAGAQQAGASKSPAAPLVQLLLSKGVITAEEAASIKDSASPGDAEQRLARLLVSKGVITREEYDQTVLAMGAVPAMAEAAPLRPVVAAARISEPAQPVPTAAPAKEASTAQSQSDGPMTTVSKIPVKIYGNVLINGGYVDRGSNTNDIPLFAQKRGTSSDQNHQNFEMTARQTRFGLRYEGSIFKDAKLTGVFELDLLGGKPAFGNGVNFDIFRVRLAYGRIDWKNDSFEAGQDWAVFSPLNPTTLASYAIPGFSTSGNLWNRFPQIRYEHRAAIGDKSKFIFTSAVLDPNAGDNAGNPAARVIGLGERSALPALETRLGFTFPSHTKESSLGVSGHYSRQIGVPGNPVGTTAYSPIDSYGISGDLNAWLSSGFRVTGEIFHGQGLGIFSGNIAQSSVVIGGRARGIISTGGWAELHGEAPAGYEGAWKKFSANFGFGVEDNRDDDLLVGIRKRNQTYMVNGQYKFSPNFTFAMEYRQVHTDWFKQPSANQKLNWASIAFLYSF